MTGVGRYEFPVPSINFFFSQTILHEMSKQELPREGVEW